MKDNSKPTYKFNWWKGFDMYKESKLIEACLSIAILMVSFGVMTLLIIKAIAPHGFIH